MIVKITKNVYRHHTNDEFNVVLVKFEPCDSFFKERMDWIPRFEDLAQIVKGFIRLDQNYANELLGIVKEEIIKSRRETNLNEFLK